MFVTNEKAIPFFDKMQYNNNIIKGAGYGGLVTISAPL